MPSKNSQNLNNAVGCASYGKDSIQFMREACWICDKSGCAVKTGAVAVKDGKIIASGHNELLSTSASDNFSDRDNSIHAESALVADAAHRGVSLKGVTLYTTRFPCITCTRSIYKAGIKRVFYMSDLFTSGNVALPLLVKLGVHIEQLKEEVVWKV
jgi:dCMP deaminase